jgi:hypothetical protein
MNYGEGRTPSLQRHSQIAAARQSHNSDRNLQDNYSTPVTYALPARSRCQHGEVMVELHIGLATTNERNAIQFCSASLWVQQSARARRPRKEMAWWRLRIGPQAGMGISNPARQPRSAGSAPIPLCTTHAVFGSTSLLGAVLDIGRLALLLAWSHSTGLEVPDPSSPFSAILKVRPSPD